MTTHRAEIDGLRAVAVLSVIFFHAGVRGFEGGFVGVDIFLVISGYLITGTILSDLTTGNFSFERFFERRARRILPALYFVLMICIPVAWILLSPKDLEQFSKSILATSLFFSNLFFCRSDGYFENSAELKPLLHTWSLAVEEQFYILFPFLMVVIWRFAKKRMFFVVSLVSFTSLMTAQLGTVHWPKTNFFLLPTRIWELGIGNWGHGFDLCSYT